jgi:hypothetical protein
VEQTLDQVRGGSDTDLSELLAADRAARQCAEALIAGSPA